MIYMICYFIYSVRCLCTGRLHVFTILNCKKVTLGISRFSVAQCNSLLVYSQLVVTVVQSHITVSSLQDTAFGFAKNYRLYELGGGGGELFQSRRQL